MKAFTCECGKSDWTYVQYHSMPPTPRWAWFDGVSEYRCDCGARYGRWTNRRLAEEEYEPRYGGGRVAFHADGLR